MSKSRHKAGQNIRNLALKRRFKALISFASAGITVFIPLFFTRITEDFLKSLPSANSSQQDSSLDLPPIVYILILVVALGFIANGIYLWKRANHADQGARGEEKMAQEVCQLEQEGWQIEFNMSLKKRLGDADIVCLSPQNKAYVIDVKSHRGEVIVKNQKLSKRVGHKIYPFEKDFLDQVLKQALQVKQQKNLGFVTPIIAFSEAKVSLPSGKLRNVYVVERSRLVTLLKSLG